MNEPNDIPPENLGGSGGAAEEGQPAVLPGKGLKDERLERRALLSRWHIPEHYRQGMLLRQIQRVLAKETSARDATQAFRAILAAEEQNMEEEKRVDQIPDHHVVKSEVVHKHEHSITARLDALTAEYDAASLAARAGPLPSRAGADRPPQPMDPHEPPL